MSEVGDLRHEVVTDGSTGLPLLHVYLSEGLAPSDVDVTTESKPDVLEVYIEHVESGRILGVIKLQGYRVPDDDVKFSKKHRRFTLRLQSSLAVAGAAELPAALGAAPAYDDAHGASHQLPGSSSGPVKHSALPASSAPTATALQPPAGNGNSFGLLDNDNISDDDATAGGEDAEASGKKKKKKKKKGKKGGVSSDAQGEAEAQDAPIANGNHAGVSAGCSAEGASSGEDVDSAPVASEGGAAGAAKKKKKKKKKAHVSIAAATVEGGAEVEVETENSSRPPTPMLSELSTSLPLAPNAVPASGVPSPPASAPISMQTSRSIIVDMEEDFGVENVGTFNLGTVVDHDPLLGPAVHSSLGKVQVKGEDKWLEAPTNAWSFKGLEGTTPVSAFGIFDGHGGRMAAQHAAKHLFPLVARFAERAVSPNAPNSPEQLESEGYIITEQDEAATGYGDDEAALRRANVMAAQDALIARLPKALHAGFVQCDVDVISRHKSSGTTATLAVQVGWELLVANVGDSLAYLDTGFEIVVISANHRVAESTEEQERILKSGGRIKPAMYGEDDPDGADSGTATPHEGAQLRVWPGGINMTRTIGDDSANGLLIAEPSVRQVSLPVTGARLIIASDGLWDAVNAKTVIGQLRTCNAREAASKAAVYAMRNKKHDDDVTVVVADFVPRESDTHVPGLLKRTSGPAAVALAAVGLKEERVVQAWRPLQSHSESWRERHRAHRQRAAVYLHNLAFAEKAESEAAEELERQRRMAVAPAAGTAGVGTAVRLPVSETYKELSELKVSLEALEDMGDEPATGEDDWTQVDAKKKKDTSFDMRKELMRAARPGEGKPARSPGGNGGGGSGRDEGAGRDERPEAGGRRERRERGGADRDRRAARRDRDTGAAAPGTAIDSAAVAVTVVRTTEAAAEQQQQQADQHRQQAPRVERRERGDRRERGGRGGRGGGRGGGSHVSAPAGEPTSTATAPGSSSVPAGVVKADGYLFVPKSVLYSGGATPAGVALTPAATPSRAGADATSTATDGAGVNKPRRDRGPRGAPRNRRDGAASSLVAPQDSIAGDQHSGEAPTSSAEDSAAPASTGPRQNALQRRRQRGREQETASAAAAVAINGLSAGAPATGRPPAAAPAAAATHMPAASSSDQVMVRDSASGHRQRRQQHAHGASHSVPHSAAQGTQAQPEPTAGASHYNRPVQQGTRGHGNAAAPTGANPTRTDGHYTQGQAQPQPHARPESYQHPPQHASHQQADKHAASQHTYQHQQRASVASAAPPTAAPTYAGPLDFGAGFGPGSSMWPPSGAPGQYSGYSANGGPAPSQRPPGLVSGHMHRSLDEVAAAAAAAVARKAAASKGPGHGQYAHRQS